jgi:hypothetical protein
LNVDGGSLTPPIDPLKVDPSAVSSLTPNAATITTPPITSANQIVNTPVHSSI